MRICNFKHSGNVGDIIWSLPVVQSFLQTRNYDKANFYLNLNEPTYYTGSHPLGNILLNKEYFDKVRPLLLEQDYVNDVEEYSEQDIQVDLDDIRRANLNYNTYSIPRWYFLVIKNTTWDLSQSWLSVKPRDTFKDKILVSRNNRLYSQFIDYTIMNDYAKDIVFVGTEFEYNMFKQQCPNCTEHYQANDFLELAENVSGCKAFVGNQGFIYTLAESLKVPRLLETNMKCGNNIPIGGECYDALYKTNFNWWFLKLLNG